jgi:hypothetical protein
MPSFLVETFLPRGVAGERLCRERRASEAAEAMTREGTRVRFGGSIHVPDEEICFFSFEAPSDSAATLVAERAGLGTFRVVEIEASVESSWHPEAT